jgi:hypothetical protein
MRPKRFGPNGKQVLALLRRAEKLTADEAVALATAFQSYIASPDAGVHKAKALATSSLAGRTAASLAGLEAAPKVIGRASSRNFDQTHAWPADKYISVWTSAMTAVAETVSAVVIMDRIVDDDGFTRQDFDALVGPWRQVIGPTWETVPA